MVFRRRDPRPILTVLTEFFFPRGGWSRAAQYVVHRLRRLPDPPHRIARGVFAGVFISFTPLFGFHFIGAWLIAWAIRGNILAALLATFFGNPLTTPVIAITSVELGHRILGGESGVSFAEVTDFFAGATTEVWRNIFAAFTADVAHWERLSEFFDGIFLPYLVGGIGPGIISGVICYYLSLPIIGAYQRLRDRKRRERIEKAIAARQRAAEKAGAEGAEAE
jgi:hypothetical protein